MRVYHNWKSILKMLAQQPHCQNSSQHPTVPTVKNNTLRLLRRTGCVYYYLNLFIVMLIA